MFKSILALNTLGPVDIALICVCAGIIVVGVAIYFLIPVFRKAQYQQQIDNLRAREAAIKAAREGVKLDESADDSQVADVSAEENLELVDINDENSVCDMPVEEGGANIDEDIAE